MRDDELKMKFKPLRCLRRVYLILSSTSSQTREAAHARVLSSKVNKNYFLRRLPLVGSSSTKFMMNSNLDAFADARGYVSSSLSLLFCCCSSVLEFKLLMSTFDFLTTSGKASFYLPKFIRFFQPWSSTGFLHGKISFPVQVSTSSANSLLIERWNQLNSNPWQVAVVMVHRMLVRWIN